MAFAPAGGVAVLDVRPVLEEVIRGLKRRVDAGLVSTDILDGDYVVWRLRVLFAPGEEWPARGGNMWRSSSSSYSR